MLVDFWRGPSGPEGELKMERDRNRQKWAPGRPSQRQKPREPKIGGDATTSEGVRQAKSLNRRVLVWAGAADRPLNPL